MTSQTKRISLKIQADELYFSEGDPYTKVIPFKGDILFDDDQKGIEKIGELTVTTMPVNLLDMSQDDMDIFDCYDFDHANAFFTLIDQDSHQLNYELLSKRIQKDLTKIKKVNILYIKTIVLHKNFRGFKIIDQVLGVLKAVFNNHLFFLKPYPLQHSEESRKFYDDLYFLPRENKATGIENLITIYSRNGFTKIKSKDSYMVLLNV